MQSLRDKLLKAGVVTAEQVEQAQARARSEKIAAPRPPSQVAETEKDRERRLNRELAMRQKQIRALCEQGEIPERGEQAFFFRTRKGEMRRMYLLPGQVAQLEQGELAIVDCPNAAEKSHALVPRAVAEQVLELEPRAIRFWARAPGESYGFEDAPAGGEVAPSEGTAS